MKITPLRRCNSPRGVVDACIDDTVTAADDAAAADAVRNILKQQKPLRLMRPYKPMRKATTSLRRSNNCIKSIRGKNALTSSITSSSSRNNSIKSIRFDALTLSTTSSLRSDCNKLRDSINLMVSYKGNRVLYLHYFMFISSNICIFYLHSYPGFWRVSASVGLQL